MYILFDIGGTNTRIGVSRDGHTIAKHTKIPTPQDFDTVLQTILSTAQELGGGENIDAVAGGIACPLREDRGTLLWAPNLPNAWVGKHLPKELSAVCDGAPVYLENDVGVVGLGEMHYGAGSAEGVALYVTISTGVNGARFVDGVLADPGMYGYEIGHQYIDVDKTACSRCERGTAIEYCSGADMEKQYGKKPYQIKDEAVWDEKARMVAYMLNNTIVHWSPRVIVLGGSMVTGSPGISVHVVKKHLKELLYIFPEIPELREAQLDAIGGLHGALKMIKQKRKK
jgi:predicted NBD/HSP70 family sugar kinase